MNGKYIWLYLTIGVSVLYLVKSSESQTKETTENNGLKEEDSTKGKDEPPFPIKWITQDLDNFNPSNTETWLMRYSEDDKYYDGSGPIFLMIGGEWAFEDSPDFFNLGMMPILAKEHNGLMLYTEHRYYGQSKPVSDLSLENLKYLSMEQALADLAHFIDYIKSSKNISSETPVITLGCSYAGSLSALMKIKYPHLALGAISSSGPTEYTVDYPEYLNHAAKVIKEFNQTCFENTRKVFEEVREYIDLPDGRQKLEKLIKPDAIPADFSDKLEMAQFYTTLTLPMRKITQLNTKWSETFSDIKIFCNLMNNEKKHASPLQRLLSYNSGELMEAFNINYQTKIAKLKNETWADGTIALERPFMYQSCTSVPLFCTNYDPDGFIGIKDAIPLEYFEKLCQEAFGPSYDMERVKRGARKTHLFFGGRKPETSNTIYVNGDMDPWYLSSTLEDLSESVHSVMIPGGSHSEELLTPVDNPVLLEAKAKISKIVAGWLAPYTKKGNKVEEKDEL